MSILVIAEHDNRVLKSATLNTLTAAGELGSDIHVLVIGNQCSAVADAVASSPMVSKVWVADNPVYQHQFAENVGELLVSIAKQYTHILAPATTFGKNLIPRAAALLDVQPIADIQEVVDGQTFKRPIYAGNVIATVTTTTPLVMLTVRTTAFAGAQDSGGSAPIEALTTVCEAQGTCLVSQQLVSSDRPDLASAKVVVSGGRGLQSAERFSILHDLADKLGGAVGASRAAVDAGFVTNDLQVGQTGKIVAPELYIAVGISGAIQHLAGMQSSKIVVAINSDEDAPIFQVADYGLVGDLFEIVPALTAQL